MVSYSSFKIVFNLNNCPEKQYPTEGKCKLQHILKWYVYLWMIFRHGSVLWVRDASWQAWWSSWSWDLCGLPCGTDQWGSPRSTCRWNPDQPSRSSTPWDPEACVRHVPREKYKKSVLPRDTNFLSTTMLTFRLLRKVMQSCMQFIGDNVITKCSIVVHLKHEGLLRRWTGGSWPASSRWPYRKSSAFHRDNPWELDACDLRDAWRCGRWRSLKKCID